MWVVLFHITTSFAKERTGSALSANGAGPMQRLGREVLGIAGAGSLGPNLFFVLSGFVMYWAYESTKRLDREGRSSFYWARVARLYPVYVVALGLGLLAQHLRLLCPNGALECTRGLGVGTSLVGVVMQQGWLPWEQSANGPAWTLTTEFLFYLSFPALIAVVRRCSTRSTWAMLAAALVATQSWIVIGALGPTRPATYDGSFAAGFWWFLHFNPLLRLPEFVAGLALGRLFTMGQLPRLRPRRAMFIVAASCAAVLTIGRILPHLTSIDVGMFANVGGFDVLFCLVIAALASSDVEALSGRRLVLLGEASFALYIIHWPVWYLFASVSPLDLHHIDGFLAWSALYLLVLVGLSLLSLRFLERPARFRIQSWRRHLSTRVVATTRTPGSLEEPPAEMTPVSPEPAG